MARVFEFKQFNANIEGASIIRVFTTAANESFLIKSIAVRNVATHTLCWAFYFVPDPRGFLVTDSYLGSFCVPPFNSLPPGAIPGNIVIPPSHHFDWEQGVPRGSGGVSNLWISGILETVT